MTLARRPARSLALPLVLTLAAACQLNFTPGIEARDQWTRTYTLAEGGAFEIRETNGRIRLEGTDGESVTVVADRIARGRTDEAAKDILSRLEIREEISPDRIVLDSMSRDSNLGMGGSRRIDYTVTVPRRTRVTLRSSNGDFEVTNVEGRLEAITTNGRVSATGLAEGAVVETTNGMISLEATGLGTGIRCQTTNGVIDVTLPADADADLSAETSNGAVSSEGLTLRVAEQSRRRLDGQLGDGGPMVRLRATNGAIRVRGR